MFLIYAGAIPETDTRPPALRTFGASAYTDLLAEIPTLVGPNEMRAAMGATRTQPKSLFEDGILQPRTTRTKVNAPWRIADGLALVAELATLSIPIEPNCEG